MRTSSRKAGKKYLGPRLIATKSGRRRKLKVLQWDKDGFEMNFAGRGGWSPWKEPVMSGYRMKCCDCGLVHEVQFRVLRRGKDLKFGSWEATRLDDKKYRVSMRMRREKEPPKVAPKEPKE